MTHTRAIASLVGTILVFGIVAIRAAGQGGTSGAGVVIVPHESWSCGLPGGIPVPESGMLVFQAETTLDRVADLGRTQYGRRQVAVVRGGTLTGARVTGSVMTGALDFE